MNKTKYLGFLVLLLLSTSSPAPVRISNMNDFNMPAWSGAGNLVLADPICIYNSASVNYQVTVTGSGPGGAYRVTSGALFVNFAVAFAGSNGTFANMTTGVARARNNANTTSTTCGGGTNAQMRVTFTNANLSAAEAASYTGLLTVLLQP